MFQPTHSLEVLHEVTLHPTDQNKSSNIGSKTVNIIKKNMVHITWDQMSQEDRQSHLTEEVS